MVIEQIFGAVVILFGLYSSAQRLRKNDRVFRKLGPMREYWGYKTGGVIHAVAYCLLPIILGAVLLF